MAKEMPVFVTRPTADGVTGALWLNAYIAFVILILMTCNVIGWSIFGLITLAEAIS